MDVNVSTIKSFVKEELGCLCPDSVFDTITLQTQVMLDNILLDSIFTIGDRLLIYIKTLDKTETQKFIDESLVRLLELGKQERDAKGLNRFRLVLFTPSPDEIENQAYQIFKKIIGNDEKMHLHILDKHSLGQD